MAQRARYAPGADIQGIHYDVLNFVSYILYFVFCIIYDILNDKVYCIRGILNNTFVQ